MKFAQPPQMATWLLKQFGCSPNNDAIIGDLAEQYHQGQTSYWYWKQTLIAIVRSLFREIGGHKWLVFRAVTVGWLMLLIFEFVTHVQVKWHSIYYQSHIALQTLVSILKLISMVASGWVVARIGGVRHSAAVLLFAGSSLFYHSMSGLATFLLVYPQVDEANRSAYFVNYLIVFNLENFLLALLILKGGGLLSASPARHSSDI